MNNVNMSILWHLIVWYWKDGSWNSWLGDVP